MADERFELSNLQDYRLYMEVSDHSLLYTAINKSNEAMAIGRSNFSGIFNNNMLSQKINTLIESSEVLTAFKRAGKANIAFVSHKHTLIPKVLFRNEEKNDYLRLSHGLQDDEVVITNELKNIDAVNIFPIFKELHTIIHHHYPSSTLLHVSTALLEGLLFQNKNNKQKQAYVNIRKDWFDIIVTEGKQLLINNTFRYETNEDIAYYTLFIYDRLKLNPEEVPLTLSGEIEKTSGIFSLLFRYIRHTGFMNRASKLNYTYKLDQFPEHYFYSLFCQTQCA